MRTPAYILNRVCDSAYKQNASSTVFADQKDKRMIGAKKNRRKTNQENNKIRDATQIVFRGFSSNSFQYSPTLLFDHGFKF